MSINLTTSTEKDLNRDFTCSGQQPLISDSLPNFINTLTLINLEPSTVVQVNLSYSWWKIGQNLSLCSIVLLFNKTFPCVQGGTSVRFRLYDKTVAMVNTHLSAHMDQVQIRDEEYWNIMSEQVRCSRYLMTSAKLVIKWSKPTVTSSIHWSSEWTHRP